MFAERVTLPPQQWTAIPAAEKVVSFSASPVLFGDMNASERVHFRTARVARRHLCECPSRQKIAGLRNKRRGIEESGRQSAC
jgi:hypothetical protein